MSAIDNTGYYTILGVDKTATAGEIKRAYYVKARTCHPDKNPDNPAAEAEFKALSEAYQVLSDPDKKELYDKYGKDGLSGPSEISPTMLFMILFGGPAFEDLIGEMSMGLLMTLSAEAATGGRTEEEQQQFIAAQMEEAMTNRIQTLAHKLLIRIEPVIQDVPGWHAVFKADVDQKLEGPGGASLLYAIGYIYINEANKKLKSFLGLGNFAASLREKGHKVGQLWRVVRSAVSASSTASKLEQIGEDETRQEERAALEEKLKKHGMTAMWRIGVMEIEDVTRAVCAKILYDDESTSDLRQKRASAIFKIGNLYQKISKGRAKNAAGVVADLETAFLDDEAAPSNPGAAPSNPGAAPPSSSSSSTKLDTPSSNNAATTTASASSSTTASPAVRAGSPKLIESAAPSANTAPSS